jgi:hypothetical protein
MEVGSMAKQPVLRQLHVCACDRCRQHPHGGSARQHRRINRLLASADERMRRLLAGFLAHQQGRGGIALVARITGLDRNTIARGQRELRRGTPPPAGRIRRPGAGRPRAEKKVRAW